MSDAHRRESSVNLVTSSPIASYLFNQLTFVAHVLCFCSMVFQPCLRLRAWMRPTRGMDTIEQLQHSSSTVQQYHSSSSTAHRYRSSSSTAREVLQQQQQYSSSIARSSSSGASYERAAALAPSLVAGGAGAVVVVVVVVPA